MKNDIYEKAESLGFKICYQIFERKNSYGYIVKDRISVVVLPNEDKKIQRYIIADCLAHYLKSDDKECFYYKTSGYLIDDEYIELIMDLLMDEKKFKKLSTKKNEEELAEYFNVPLFLIKKKLSSVKQKTKKYKK